MAIGCSSTDVESGDGGDVEDDGTLVSKGSGGGFGEEGNKGEGGEVGGNGVGVEDGRPVVPFFVKQSWLHRRGCKWSTREDQMEHEGGSNVSQEFAEQSLRLRSCFAKLTVVLLGWVQ